MESIISASPSLLGAAAVLVVASLILVFSQGSTASYPPGPPREFLIGSLRYFPQNNFWQAFCDWAHEYGDVTYAAMPGVSMLNINSIEVAQELLGRRTNTTGGRKIGYMVKRLMGWGWSLAFLDPGHALLEQRKMLRRGIGPQRIASHNPQIEKTTSEIIVGLKAFEGDPMVPVRAAIGQMLIQMTYGEEIWKTMGLDLVAWNTEITNLVNVAFYGVWIVDMLPIFRFLPDWLPGVTFKRIANRGNEIATFIREKPFACARELYNTGAIGHSLANDLLDEFGASENARDAMAVLCTAGSDSTTSATVAFIFALYHFPKIAQKVYEEIIRVTGGERLPQITDRQELPYTEAVWKESLRWRPPVTLGIPHTNNVDEVINGYRIPKGTILNANIGFMLTDAKVWGDPEVFRPERFLGEEGQRLPNPLVLVFGFGMRVCPGMYFADRIGFHIVASIASLYDIIPVPGEALQDPRNVEFSDTAFRYPIGFKCRFKIKDETAGNLVKTISLGM